MEHFLTKAGIDIGELKVAAQFNDPDSIKHSVSQGMGISIISKTAVEDYENFGLLLSFDLSGISMDRYLYIVSHKNNPLPFIRRGVSQFREDVLRQIVVTSSRDKESFQFSVRFI